MAQLMARMPKLAHFSSRICMCKGWPNYYIKCGEKGVPPVWESKTAYKARASGSAMYARRIA